MVSLGSGAPHQLREASASSRAISDERGSVTGFEFRLLAAPPWCNVVQLSHSPMAKKSARSSQKDAKSIRASVSFPAGRYRELERIAEQKKVSLAWVVREAAEKYIAEQWPLLERREDRT